MCAGANDCMGVEISDFTLRCNNDVLATVGPLQISGAGAMIERSNISDCHSIAGGGFIQANFGASVTISDSAISHSSSKQVLFCHGS